MTIETIAQRDLRNHSGEILRRARAGESFIVTNNGTPVAKVVPIDDAATGLRVSRPARRRGGWTQLAMPGTAREESVEDALDDMRGNR